MREDVPGLLTEAAGYVCELHGSDSRACRAASELATLGVTAFAGASIGAALGKSEGALIGGILGLVAGAWLNSLDAPAPARPPLVESRVVAPQRVALAPARFARRGVSPL